MSKKVADYAIGYAKPPGHSQFRKGQSGNPKGRPKGARNLKAELMEELQEKITIREDGTPKRLSKLRVLIKTLFGDAIKGNARAAQILLDQMRVLDTETTPDTETDLSAMDRVILERMVSRLPRAKKRAHEG